MAGPIDNAIYQKGAADTQADISKQLGLPGPAALKSVTDAMLLLVQNGADRDSAKAFFFSGGAPTSQAIATADLILANPAIVPFWVRRFPSQGLSDYTTAEMGFGFTQALAEQKTAGPTDIIPGGRQQTQVTPQGGPMVQESQGQEATRYDNGVIVIRNLNDPTQAIQVLYPNDTKGRVAGSTRWLDKKEGQWDSKTVNSWRKRLIGLGYQITPKGGFDPDLRQAIALAYQDFYRNGKKWRAPEQGAAVPPLREAFDPNTAQLAIRDFFQKTIGDDPTDHEMKQGTEWLKDYTRSQLHKGLSPAESFSRAEAGYYNQLYDDPLVKYRMDQQKENTTLRDSLIQAAQATSQIAGGG